MTEISWFWPTDLVGDGMPIPDVAGWPDIFAAFFAPFTPSGHMGQAVPDQRGNLYNLQYLTTVTEQVTMQIGAALIGGIFYRQDAAGAVNWLAEQWPDNAQHTAYTRIKAKWSVHKAKLGGPGIGWNPGEVTAPPLGGGVIGDEVDFTMAEVTYRFGPSDPAPIISLAANYYLTYNPYYLQNASQICLHRQGGSATVWPTAGNTNYRLEKPCKVNTCIIKAAASGTSGTEPIIFASSLTSIFDRDSVLIATCLSHSDVEFGLYYNGGLAHWEIQWTRGVAAQPEWMIMGISEVTLN